MNHLLTEIAEQPAALAGLLDRVVPDLDRLASDVWRDDVRYVVLVARGSSDNAARYGQYLFGLQHRLPVALATPSLGHLYGVTPEFSGAAVIAVSQSGQSPDVVGVLDAARRQGRPALAITNDPGSPLADAATEVLDLGVGSERAVAATKTYTSSLLALALLSTARTLAPERDRLLTELRQLPELVSAALDVDVEAAAHALRDVTHLLVAGRGLNYGTAFEAALKVRELSGVVAEAFSPPDLLHGPIAAVAAGAAALLIAPDEPSLANQHELIEALRGRHARITTVSGDRSVLAAADAALELGAQPAAWLTPITTIVPVQRLAAAMTRDRGRDLDAPEGLTKITRTQ
jgi:glutamine---fructose-6-phosphate transaminase (isomerizing)